MGQSSCKNEVSQNLNFLDEVLQLNKKSTIQSGIDEYLSKNNNTNSALLVLSLENFQYINDTFGSRYSKLFLKTIIKELRKYAISNDFICRIGFKKFLIFVYKFSALSEIENKVRDIIDTLNKAYNIQGANMYVSSNIGISTYPQNGANFLELLRNANIAMDMSRTNGKNQYKFFNNYLSKYVDREYMIQCGLTNAIENNEMYVVFQPKVKLAHNKINGFEALLRWNNSSIGLVKPSEFIPVAEETGYIIPIGNFVIEEVFKKIRLLLQSGYEDFKIALNLSYIQLQDENVVNYIKELCSKYEVQGKYLEFEVTESILIKSYEKTTKYLYELKKIGATIALDDFGTGYSSLNYLTKLPIDSLKIDRSFLVDITENYKSRWIVKNIIELSHKLGIEVIAEGVELEEQVTYLKSILCDIVQGYFYSKPQLFEKVVILLEK